MFSLRYCKDIVNWLFLVLWACLATHTQSDTVILQKTFVFICRQKSTSSPMLLWRYCIDMQTYFGYFGHAQLHSPKMVVSPRRRLRCLSACKKQTSSFSSFLRYYILKNSATCLAGSILAHNSRPEILPDVLVNNNINFHFRLISRKT